MKKYIVIAICAGQLCSCSNMSDETKTYAQGTAIGSGAGVVLGGLIGNVIGRDSKSTAIGAGIGALVGAGLGYAWGDYVVKQKREYASVEEQIQHSNQVLDERIDMAKRTNREVQASIANLKRQNKKMAAKDAKTAIANIDKCISLLSEEATLANMSAQKATGQQRTALRGKISTLNGEIATLKKNKRIISTLSA